MSELIDREAALDAIKFAEFGCEYEEVEKVPIFNPWHRVDEELPKDNTWCVFISWDKHNLEQYRWIGTYSKEWGFQDDDNFMVDNVKYWMPLPEPPQEDA